MLIFDLEGKMEAKQSSKTKQKKKTSPTDALRKRKIISYQERIRSNEEMIRGMERDCCALEKTSIEGLSVRHKSFGNGTIIEKEDSIITVNFDFGSKRFVMPSAFIDGFLKAEDEEIEGKLSRYKEMGERIKEARKEIKDAQNHIQLLARK